MPKKANAKGDVGTAKVASDSYDLDNTFLTEEGWVYRHFKTQDKTKFWDEIIVAGQSDGTDTEPSTISGDDNFDFEYSSHQITGAPGTYSTKVVTTGGGVAPDFGGSGNGGGGGGGGGGTGGAVDSINIAPPAGGSVESNGSITIDEGDATLTASTTGAGTGATYAWTASGDASIKSGADQASAVVTLTYSTGTGTATVAVTDSDTDGNSETLQSTTTFNVNDPSPGGGTGGALDEININDPTGGAPVEGFTTYTLTASNTGGDSGATYAWVVTGDGEIEGAADQASVVVKLEYTGSNDNGDQNGTAAATVTVTAGDGSETIEETANLIVLKPYPVIGSVTPSSTTDPIRATEPSNWKTTVTLGTDSGPTESENTVWSTNPSSGVTIVEDGSNEATITFPDQQSYSVTAELTRTNSRGDSVPVSGSASITPNPAPTPSTTFTYNVVVNGNTKYQLTGEGLTDSETPTLTIAEGDTIIFKQGDASNSGHPINIYRNADKSGLTVQGVSQVGTPGDGDANTQTVYLNLDGAGTYYYQCENHDNMGGQITVTA